MNKRIKNKKIKRNRIQYYKRFDEPLFVADLSKRLETFGTLSLEKRNGLLFGRWDCSDINKQAGVTMEVK
jgi:hypothetical protein